MKQNLGDGGYGQSGLSNGSHDPERRILGIVHQENAGPGSFGSLAVESKLSLEIASFADQEPPELSLEAYDAVIVFGGSQQVDQEQEHPWLLLEKRFIRETIDRRIPLLGVCLGAQLIAEQAGAWVGPSQYVRRGWHDVAVAPEADGDPVVGGMPTPFTTVVWHSYEFRLPPGATPLASTSTSLQAFRLEQAPVWAVQFHPEVEPDGLARWVQTYRERLLSDVSAAELDSILANSERHQCGQEMVAKRIFTNFIRAAAAAGP